MHDFAQLEIRGKLALGRDSMMQGRKSASPIAPIIVLLGCLFYLALPTKLAGQAPQPRYPVLYSTDLYYYCVIKWRTFPEKISSDCTGSPDTLST